MKLSKTVLIYFICIFHNNLASSQTIERLINEFRKITKDNTHLRIDFDSSQSMKVSRLMLEEFERSHQVITGKNAFLEFMYQVIELMNMHRYKESSEYYSYLGLFESVGYSENVKEHFKENFIVDLIQYTLKKNPNLRLPEDLHLYFRHIDVDPVYDEFRKILKYLKQVEQESLDFRHRASYKIEAAEDIKIQDWYRKLENPLGFDKLKELISYSKFFRLTERDSAREIFEIIFKKNLDKEQKIQLIESYNFSLNRKAGYFNDELMLNHFFNDYVFTTKDIARILPQMVVSDLDLQKFEETYPKLLETMSNDQLLNLMKRTNRELEFRADKINFNKSTLTPLLPIDEELSEVVVVKKAHEKIFNEMKTRMDTLSTNHWVAFVKATPTIEVDFFGDVFSFLLSRYEKNTHIDLFEIFTAKDDRYFSALWEKGDVRLREIFLETLSNQIMIAPQRVLSNLLRLEDDLGVSREKVHKKVEFLNFYLGMTSKRSKTFKSRQVLAKYYIDHVEGGVENIDIFDEKILNDREIRASIREKGGSVPDFSCLIYLRGIFKK